MVRKSLKLHCLSNYVRLMFDIYVTVLVKLKKNSNCEICVKYCTKRSSKKNTSMVSVTSKEKQFSVKKLVHFWNKYFFSQMGGPVLHYVGQ